MLPWLLALALATVLPVGKAAARADPRPNIVLIVSDDLGYGDLGSFGSEEIRTPALDRLAREGVRATSFYVTSPMCTPSRGSILTGRYPQRNGLYDQIRNDVVDFGETLTPEKYEVSAERVLGMDTREIMISQVMKKAGYVTGIFGKWDGGQLKRYLPLQRGFDRFYGFVSTGIDYFTHERYGIPSMYRDNDPTTADRGTYATYLFQREATRFIQENRDRTFFLYLPFNAPHEASNLDPGIRGAAQAPRKCKGLYPHLREGYERGELYGKAARVPSWQKRRLEYLGAVTCMDEAIGELLALLESYKLADSTLVIFLSDNGGGAGASDRPLRGRKGQLFEGGVRVPLLVRYPGVVPAGTVSDGFLTSLELFPTLTRLAGEELPAGVVYDGFDMLSVLAGRVESPRTEMFWKRRGDRAARIGNYKWIESRHGRGLYDLAKDPGEKHDLSEEEPQRLAEMQARFDAWLRTMLAAEDRGPFKDF